MELKLEWLSGRQKQLMEELSQCHVQHQETTEQAIKEKQEAKQEIERLKEQSLRLAQNKKEDSNKHLLRVETLQALVAARDSTVEALTRENKSLKGRSEEVRESLLEKEGQILQLEHNLRQEQELRITQGEALRSQIEKLHRVTQEQLSSLHKEHEDKVMTIEQQAQRRYDAQMGEVKRNNLLIIQKMQEEYQSKTDQSQSSNQQLTQEQTRIIGENSQLRGNLNEYKLKLMEVETNVSTLEHQNKILEKELEIFKENSHRESKFLKEERSSLVEKNKRLADKNEELSWQLRESQLRRDEELSRMKRQVDASFKDVLRQAEQEQKKGEAEIRQMKDTVNATIRQRQEIQGELKRKQEHLETVETRITQKEEQIQQLKQENIRLMAVKKQGSGDRFAMECQLLRKQVIRKNCELEVYQEQIKRLKAKVNGAAKTQEEAAKKRQQLQKENKMLISQLVFLRDKKKGNGRMGASRLEGSNFLGDMNSERSRVEEDIEEYKKMIEMMSEDMNEVSKKVIEKDILIQKLQGQIRRYQMQLAH